MTPEEDLERFFKDVSAKDREWVESWWEYQLALSRGKPETALEIACVLLLGKGPTREYIREINIILHKTFPELSE